MLVKYFWEDVTLNVENNYGTSPHTHKVVRDVEYDYDIDIKIEDIVDYLIPYHLEQKEINSEEKLELRHAKTYMTKAIEFLVENCQIDLDELEQDETFKEYMKDKYESSAWEEFQERNEEY